MHVSGCAVWFFVRGVIVGLGRLAFLRLAGSISLGIIIVKLLTAGATCAEKKTGIGQSVALLFCHDFERTHTDLRHHSSGFLD